MSLRFIISPAKKMRVQDAPPWPVREPAFLDRAEILMRAVQRLSRDEAKALWSCSDRLADLRRRKGLSQEQLGYELGVSRQTVSKWELGQSYPDFQRLVLLSDYYEMSLDELMRGVDVGDVRALNESEKQISSIYSDVERGKEAALRAWRAFLVVGCVVLALFALVVAYGVLSGGLFVR